MSFLDRWCNILDLHSIDYLTHGNIPQILLFSFAIFFTSFQVLKHGRRSHGGNHRFDVEESTTIPKIKVRNQSYSCFELRNQSYACVSRIFLKGCSNSVFHKFLPILPRFPPNYRVFHHLPPFSTLFSP